MNLFNIVQRQRSLLADDVTKVKKCIYFSRQCSIFHYFLNFFISRSPHLPLSCCLSSTHKNFVGKHKTQRRLSQMTDLAKELAIESNNWRHGKFFLVVHISKPVATATQQQQLMPPPPSPRKRPPTPDQIQHQQQQQQQQVEPDDKFFYVEHNPLVSATNVVLHTFTGQNNQQWLFENGGYIRNVQTYVGCATKIILIFIETRCWIFRSKNCYVQIVIIH